MSQAYDFFGSEQPEPPALYPDSPGYRRRETSKQAAEAVAPRAGSLRDRVLAEISKRASTPDEVADRLGETVLSIRPRVTELSKKNLIADSGQRRQNASGRNAIVWKVAR